MSISLLFSLHRIRHGYGMCPLLLVLMCLAMSAPSVSNGLTPVAPLEPRPTVPAPKSGRLACGHYACCTVRGGRVACWGSKYKGATGLVLENYGTASRSITTLPYLIFSDTVPAVEVAMKEYATCALFLNGRVRCWGSMDWGQAGIALTFPTAGDKLTRVPYVSFSDSNPIEQVVVGQYHVCALFRPGRVRCWGRNSARQLGLEDKQLIIGLKAGETDTIAPLTWATTHVPVHLAAGLEHTCALFRTSPSDNTTVGIRCWGSNSFGQCGYPNDANTPVTPQIPFVPQNTTSPINSVSMGSSRTTCATYVNGEARCWGSNGWGYLGQDDNLARGRYIPVSDVRPLAIARRATAMGGGLYHNCAILNATTHICWGYPRYCALGDSSVYYTSAPGAPSITTIATVAYHTTERTISIDSGTYHTCIIFESSRIICAGYTLYGINGQDVPSLFGNGGGNPKTSDMGFIRFSNPFLLYPKPASLPLRPHTHTLQLYCNPYIPATLDYSGAKVRLTYDKAGSTAVMELPATYPLDPTYYKTELPVFNQTGNISLALDVDNIGYQNDIDVYIYNEPNTTAVSPLSGPITGGTVLTLTGQGYLNNPMFDIRCCIKAVGSSTEAAYLFPGTHVTNSSQIVCTTPAMDGTLGGIVGQHFVNISVALNGRDCDPGNVPFYVYDETKLAWNSFTPTLGPTTGGTNVSINVTNLQVTADPVTVSLGPYVLCPVDPQAIDPSSGQRELYFSTADISSSGNVTSGQSVDVQISVNGQQFISTGLKWRFYTPPQLLAISPAAATIVGGFTITLQGTGFLASDEIQVRFKDSSNAVKTVKGTYVPFFEYITFVMPSTAAGDTIVDISLNSQQFHNTRILKSFDLFQLRPQGGPVAGGTVVTLVGIGLMFSGPTLRCRFDSTIVPATFISASSISCASPGESLPVIRSVDMSVFNEFTSRTLPYSYYQAPVVTAATPLAAPTDTTSTVLTLSGTGFVLVSPGARCHFGSTIVSGTVNTTSNLLRCPVPAGAGSVPLKVSFNSYDVQNTKFLFSYFKMTSLSPLAGPTGGGTEVAISGSGFIDGLYCKFKDKVVPAFRQGPGSVLCVSPPMAQAGTVKVRLSGDGKEFTVSTLDFTYYQSPVPQHVTPVTGPEAGGTVVTVTGGNFTQPVTGEQVYCRFGDQRVLGSMNSAGNVTCTSPSSSGSVRVDISLNSGKDFSTESHAYFYHFDIAEMEPNIGPTSGSTEVTLKGGVWPQSLFSHTDRVKCRFGDGAVIPYRFSPAKYLTDTTLSCSSVDVPAGTTSTPVAMTTNGISFSKTLNFIYYQDVVPSDMQPRAGPARGGSLVTIFGENFRNDSGAQLHCLFQLKPSPRAQVITKTSATCVSPPGGGRLDVSVSLNGANYVPVGSFQYYSALSVAPQFGPRAGGTELSIKGSGFVSTGTPRMRMGGSVTVARFVSEASVLATTPPVPIGVISNSTSRRLRTLAALGHVGVELSFNGVDYTSGTSQSVQFTYYDPPALTAITPSIGPTIGGTPVTVFGTGFLHNGLMACRFGSGAGEAIEPAHVISTTELLCNSSVHSVGTIYVALSGNSQQFHINDGKAAAAYTYTECPKGTFSKVHTDPCTPCPPGQYGPGPGLRECLLCGAAGYSVQPGSTECLPCPSNTTITASVSDSLSKCECQPGSYHPQGKTGEPCLACPLGSECAGGTSPALAVSGFWAAPESPYLFIECDRASACPGGQVSKCSDGYSGRLCADCLPGYFQSGDACDPCPPQNGQAEMLFIGFFIFCYIVAIVLLRVVDEDSSNSAGGMITIFTTSFQVLAMIAAMSLDWPDIIVRTINIATLPFTLNLDLFASECSLPGFTFKHKWAAKTSIPFVFGVVLLSLYVVAWLHNKVLGAERWSERKRSDRAELTGWRKFLLTPTDMENYANRMINSLAMMFTLVFLMMVVNALVIFDCTRRVDGKWTLDAQPSLLCFEPWWYEMMPLGVTALVIYGLIVPLGLGFWVHKNRHRLTHPDFASRWGSVFANFKEQYPYFETVIMFEKFALATCMLFFTTYPMFQLISVLTVLLVTLLIQIFLQPYASSDDNEVGMAMGWCLCLTLIIGALIHSHEVPFHGITNFLIVLFFIVFGFCCFLLIAVFAHGFRKTVRLLRTKRESDEARRIIRNLCFPHGRKKLETWVKEEDTALFDTKNFDRCWMALGMYYNRHKSPAKQKQDLATDDAFHDEEALRATEYTLDQLTGHCLNPDMLPTLRRWFFSRCRAARKQESQFSQLAKKDLHAFFATFGQFSRWRASVEARMRASFLTRVRNTLFPSTARVQPANEVAINPFSDTDGLQVCTTVIRMLYHADRETAEGLAQELCSKLDAPQKLYGAQTLRLGIHLVHSALTTRPEDAGATSVEVLRASANEIITAFGNGQGDISSGESYYGYTYEDASSSSGSD